MSEITGVLKLVNSAQTFGTFTKREFVLTVTEDQYPQHLNLELHQDKVSLIDDFKVGDTIKVNINLRGKEWINPAGVAKYFNSIVVWRIEKVSAVQNIPPAVEHKIEKDTTFSDSGNDEFDDDLPF